MSKITMEFARQDDCLDKMVPSDLRLLIGERNALAAQVEVLNAQLKVSNKAFLHIINLSHTRKWMMQGDIEQIIESNGELLLATPAACLAQVRAEAVNRFLHILEHAPSSPVSAMTALGVSQWWMKFEQASSIRQGGDV
jgi:hypothetical protein